MLTDTLTSITFINKNSWWVSASCRVRELRKMWTCEKMSRPFFILFSFFGVARNYWFIISFSSFSTFTSCLWEDCEIGIEQIYFLKKLVSIYSSFYFNSVTTILLALLIIHCSLLVELLFLKCNLPLEPAQLGDPLVDIVLHLFQSLYHYKP